MRKRRGGNVRSASQIPLWSGVRTRGSVTTTVKQADGQDSDITVTKPAQLLVRVMSGTRNQRDLVVQSVRRYRLAFEVAQVHGEVRNGRGEILPDWGNETSLRIVGQEWQVMSFAKEGFVLDYCRTSTAAVQTFSPRPSDANPRAGSPFERPGWDSGRALILKKVRPVYRKAGDEVAGRGKEELASTGPDGKTDELKGRWVGDVFIPNDSKPKGTPHVPDEPGDPNVVLPDNYHICHTTVPEPLPPAEPRPPMRDYWGDIVE